MSAPNTGHLGTAPNEEMQLEERTVGDIAIVSVIGDITLRRCRHVTLLGRVRKLAEQGHRKVLIDLSAVSFVDSAGLGELLKTQSVLKNHGGAVKLSLPTGRLRDLLELTRLTTVLRVYEDETKALESFAVL